MAKDCHCGRSLTGKCCGWHVLNNEEYAKRVEEVKKKELSETSPRLLSE